MYALIFEKKSLPTVPWPESVSDGEEKFVDFQMNL